jgi:hypothetical protein
MWRWPFRGPNCVFCKCSSTTVWIHVERCTLTSTHEGTLWSVRIYHDILDDNNIEQCWRTSLFTVTTRHGSPPPSTLTQQRKRRACHSHPPRLAACHPMNCPLRETPAKRTFALLCKDICSDISTAPISKRSAPARSKHKTTQEISSPPSSLTCDLPPPYPATLTSGLPITNSVLCVDRAHPTVGLLLAGYPGRFEVAA